MTIYRPTSNLLMIVGNYGSGKTEVAVNVAVQMADEGRRVDVADLDIVNPYFRCREARELMERRGIRVVMPPGAQAWADLPIVLPEIKGMLHPEGDRISLFDVGGDDVGAKLLSSFVEALKGRTYSLLQVVNSRRPFTDTVEGCLKMKRDIEAASRLKVTGLVANSHLVAETTVEVILEGWRLARSVSEASGVPVEFVTAMGDLADDPALKTVQAPVLRLTRIMLPPWLRPAEKKDSANPEKSAPAERARPIFRP
ncbi:MAG: cobalamin biosynthesis protein CbiA [Deltaproteobacteria bacterium]|nr:cobalamin biosynthesis protein CbiA [Deltaproteobacteria bacterium]